MDFRLSEEQIMLQQTVREFAQKELKPQSLELDAQQDPKECFPWELLKKASKLGLRTCFLPREYGGGGLDYLSRIVMLEELGAGDSGFAYTLFIGSSVMDGLVRNCSKQVIDEFIGKIVEDDTFCCANATTEPDHGSDIHLPYDAPGVLKTFAKRKGDQYIINGTKLWISNGGAAKLYVVCCRTKLDAPISESMSAFLVSSDTTGFSIGKIANKLGCRLEMNAELVFEDACIPARYLVGKENQYWPIRMRGIDIVVNYKNAVLTGLLRAIYEETVEYAKMRIQGGKPIIEHPTVGVMLSEMRAQIEAARLLGYHNGWSLDNQQYDQTMGWLTKGYLCKIAVEIVSNALEIHGAVGHERGTFMEKYLRDVYSQLHGTGLRTIALLKARPTL